MGTRISRIGTPKNLPWTSKACTIFAIKAHVHLIERKRGELNFRHQLVYWLLVGESPRRKTSVSDLCHRPSTPTTGAREPTNQVIAQMSNKTNDKLLWLSSINLVIYLFGTLADLFWMKVIQWQKSVLPLVECDMSKYLTSVLGAAFPITFVING